MTHILQGFAGPVDFAGLKTEPAPLHKLLSLLSGGNRNIGNLAEQISFLTQGDAGNVHSLQSQIKPHLSIVEQGELARALAAGNDGKGADKGEGFTISGTSHVFKIAAPNDPNAKGTTLSILFAGEKDPALLLAMANSFHKEGIRIEATIADIKGEIAALPPAERMAAAQRAYNALNNERCLELSYHSGNQRLEELINEFNQAIANPLIQAGQIYPDYELKNPANHILYVLKPGETLSGIAARHGALTPGYLAAQNGIADPGNVKAGTAIKVPTDAFIAARIREQYHLLNLVNDANGAAVPDAVRNFDIYQGQPNPYGRFGSMVGLQRAAGAEYQRLVDAGYARGVELWEAGEIEGRNRNQAIGVFMDDYARINIRKWLGDNKIEIGSEHVAQVYVNRRLYDPDGLKFRIPDLRIGDRFYDASLASKSETTPQIKDFYRFGNPETVTIMRPTALGGAYDIPRPKGQN